MVIRDFDIEGVTFQEAEADPPLVVDRNGVLALSVASQLVKPVPWWHLEIIQRRGQMDVFELASRPLDDIRWQPFGPSSHEQILCVPVCKRPDHVTSYRVT